VADEEDDQSPEEEGIGASFPATQFLDPTLLVATRGSGGGTLTRCHQVNAKKRPRIPMR
jgi:hypothetical protein